MSPSRRTFLKLAALLPAAVRASAEADPNAGMIERIRPLFKAKTPAQPGDWLAEHKETGQTYAAFRSSVRRRAVDSYSSLRIVPIGPLTAGQTSVLKVVTDILKPFFGLPLELDPPVPLVRIPSSAQRNQFEEEPTQLLTTYLLSDVLVERRQATDAAVLGITAQDLWPGAGWNFVFGQASLNDRVGVWSMARNGDSDASSAMRKRCALRTAMTATHETGHMFGIRHCIAYECGMNGSNQSDERDRQPLEFCAECQPKLWWTLKLDPLARSRALEAVARKHGFTPAAEGFRRQAELLAPR